MPFTRSPKGPAPGTSLLLLSGQPASAARTQPPVGLWPGVGCQKQEVS
jgi:hypothetical protein